MSHVTDARRRKQLLDFLMALNIIADPYVDLRRIIRKHLR